MIKDPFARLGLDREVLTVSQLNGRARVPCERCQGFFQRVMRTAVADDQMRRPTR